MELLATFLPFILMMGLMWFLMIRPQQKQAKDRKSMLDSMQPGNHVVTIGGLHGILDEINRAKQTVVIDCEGVYLTFNIAAISTVKEATPTIKATEEEVLEEVETEVEFEGSNVATEA